MDGQKELNYNRISEAIDYIRNNFRDQPSLEEIAEKVHLSPFHFQRLFSDWAGTTPKRFLQYISLEHAKSLLKDQQATLFNAAMETGLSGTGRLHDLFINVEGMTPAEYKNGGVNLVINYRFAESPFGKLIVASTMKGVCHLAFIDNGVMAVADLKKRFPNASFQLKDDLIQHNALAIFQNDWNQLPKIKLHLKGTDFQLKVWETLLKIPMGKLSTYGKIAEHIGRATASRAVGTAIGSNPVAFLIPCHRVIQSSGGIGGYRWGTVKKTAMIGWESAKTDSI
ncbi:methylated-DNA--[protein]-cysteine S-methyltransferase [Albibacterium indicum]|uniref:methylated-DNA--[protein]-cysteine S-methyltransferase n=1 Tax=Albibacterium indicum TaxID=2292082 RepID=UPI000E4909AB|nr:methylated-DNA--[protein]-cysteine S-methyltransferase [Pedobacter indicus]